MPRKRNPAKLPKLPRPLTGEQPRWKLQSWHYKFANWLIAAPKVPTIAEQEAEASRLATIPVTYRQIRRFKQRPDFQDYVERVSAGGIEAAKQLFINDLPLYAELFRWGAERARQKDDVRGLAQYTIAAADRILPRKPDVALVQPQQFTFVMSEQRLASIDAPTIEVTCEPVDAGATEPAKQLPRPRSTEELYRSVESPEPHLMTYSEMLRDPRYGNNSQPKRTPLPQRSPRPLPGEG